MFEHQFEAAPVDSVTVELARFQNEDGGFGRALEPDLRTPSSSALATGIGLRMLRELGHSADYHMVRKAVQYLLATFDHQSNVRWSFPYWGMALALSAGFSDQSGWWAWSPLALVAVIASLLTRTAWPLRQLATGVWHDWTPLSFAFYGTLPLALLMAFDLEEFHGEESSVMILSAVMALGALAHMRSTRMGQRALALLGGLTLSWGAATVYLANYWYGRQEQSMPGPGDWSRTIQGMTNRGVGLLVLLLAPTLVGLLHLGNRPIRSWWAAPKGRIANRALIPWLQPVAALIVLTVVLILVIPHLQNLRSDRPPPLYLDAAQAVMQGLSWGEVQQERPASADTMFATTGRHLYVIGDIDGGFRPRSNPYDLHNFGAPSPNDPLATNCRESGHSR